jgi:hypothetical protein
MPTHFKKSVVIKPSAAGLGLVKTTKNPDAVATAAPTTRSMARRNAQKGPRFAR